MCAKKVLYEIYSGDLGDFLKRKTSGKRSEQLAHVEDIVDSLILLDNKEDCISFNFVAHDLNRLPRFNPNETDNFAIAEKLAMLEARLDSIEYIASENKVTGIKNKDDICDLVRLMKKQGKQSYSNIMANNIPHQEVGSRDPQ